MAFMTMSQHSENSSYVLNKALSVVALLSEQTEEHLVQLNSVHINSRASPWQITRLLATSQRHTCMCTLSPLTFTIWFQISVHRRGLAITKYWSARRGLRTGAETHVSRWGDLLSQGGELHGARGHGDIVCFMHWLWQTARVMVRWGVCTHGYIVLFYLFCGMATHWHHPFVFLKGEKTYIYVFTKDRCMRLYEHIFGYFFEEANICCKEISLYLIISLSTLHVIKMSKHPVITLAFKHGTSTTVFKTAVNF